MGAPAPNRRARFDDVPSAAEPPVTFKGPFGAPKHRPAMFLLMDTFTEG
jgi:hypothetical protein